MAKFTVDTHLFRELGELLVGRDSTALIELVKNAYDADATEVTVYGEGLDQPETGFIRISDNGTGMSRQTFQEGFLRIASRVRDQGERRSLRFGRRFTGAKGIGRLAAHKLARSIDVVSIPAKEIRSDGFGVEARIDWDVVEQFETLDDLELSDAKAIVVREKPIHSSSKPGTVITLNKLRRSWTRSERVRFISEVQTFSPPEVLVAPPSKLVKFPLAFERPLIADEKQETAPFTSSLEGDFSSGEEYWQVLAETAHWIIEIDARNDHQDITYNILPTKTFLRQFPETERTRLSMPHPDPVTGPFFQARILLREGTQVGSREIKSWAASSYGVRVFMEGFRVLPYGEKSNDWLSLDLDYANRPRTSAWLANTPFADESADENAFLIHLANRNYFGGVFLTQSRAPSLKMLVNREGFVPDAAYQNLVTIVRVGIDICTRARAAAKIESRQERSQTRRKGSSSVKPDAEFSSSIDETLKRVKTLVGEAREKVAQGDLASTAGTISELEDRFSELSEKLITESAMLRVLASVGTQMAAFVHEINGLLGMSEAVERAMTRIRESAELPKESRKLIATTEKSMADLRRSLERQAAYLTDVITPDARRRRSRLSLGERFDSGWRLIEGIAQRRGISVENRIPKELLSPPMFPAEITTVFSNLLTNAVKAAGEGGKIRATGTRAHDGSVVIRIENTGVAVRVDESERWFKPFESTTTSIDPVLGQGMGLGLPITRSMLEQYGVEIKFVKPSHGYSTALEIRFPK